MPGHHLPDLPAVATRAGLNGYQAVPRPVRVIRSRCLFALPGVSAGSDYRQRHYACQNRAVNVEFERMSVCDTTHCG